MFYGDYGKNRSEVDGILASLALYHTKQLTFCTAIPIKRWNWLAWKAMIGTKGVRKR